MIIIVSNQRRSTNTNASAQLINLGGTAGGSRCGDPDVLPLQDTAWKPTIRVSPLLKCGTVPQWGPRRSARGGGGCCDSCKTTSFISLVGNRVHTGPGR